MKHRNSVSITVESVEAPGAKLTVHVAGPTDGPLALVLHGFPDSPVTWERIIDHLASAGYHVVAPFLRGYAPSTPAKDNYYGMPALISDACKVYGYFQGDSNAVLIGHDWGAEIAHSLLSVRPGYFRSAVTMSVPPTGGTAIDTKTLSQMRRSWYAFMFALPGSMALASANDFELLRSLCRLWSPSLHSHPQFDDVLTCFRHPANLAAALAYYRDSLTGTPTPVRYAKLDRLARATISTPVLYLHGSEDGCIDPILAGLCAENLPKGSKTEILDGVGHFPHLEAEAILAAKICSWFGTGYGTTT